jgi:predicted dehydrogenase
LPGGTRTHWKAPPSHGARKERPFADDTPNRQVAVPRYATSPRDGLAPVATPNEQSAKEAAESFGADRWFSDPFAMIRDDRIDVVTISV